MATTERAEPQAPAPTVATTVGVSAFTEDSPPVVVDAGVTVGDVDNANLASATVTITNVFDTNLETLADYNLDLGVVEKEAIAYPLAVQTVQALHSCRATPLETHGGQMR